MNKIGEGPGSFNSNRDNRIPHSLVSQSFVGLLHNSAVLAFVSIRILVSRKAALHWSERNTL